ncbi:unnamed protein product [Miscanthus lutarioriparius]|uniref:Uncharacterized protein n=1 Tax=Miscanthus lutarioriparius TaxID=422564 RepID=A0A811RM41_9POAL|nr:unnamed protein product [Miscanthus lutarioriparius]
MRTSKSAAAPPASLTSPKSCATKRQRKAAAAAPLGDVTNLLVVAETPTTSKPRRTARRSLPAPSNVSAASSASVTPAPKPSSAAVLEEERSVLKSPTISTVHRRTTEAQGRWRRNPTAANSKGKEPVAATARCPPLGKSARTNSSGHNFQLSNCLPFLKQKWSIASTPNLLLLEKQRVYFADIEAFELVEEEASESELE